MGQQGGQAKPNSENAKMEAMIGDGASIVGEDQSAANALMADLGGKQFDGWTAKYRIPIHAITIKSQHKKSLHVVIELQNVKQERELIFDSIEDAQSVCEHLEKEKKLESTRSETRLKVALGEIKLPPFETITLLIEVVSGWDLPIGDYATSDPYVVCLLGRIEVHRTHVINNT